MSKIVVRIAALALALLAGAALFARCDEEDVQLSPNVQRLPDIQYAQGYVRRGDPVLRPLLLDVLAPVDAPATGKTAVLLVHGGSFTSGSRHDPELVRFADALASQGFVCFLSDYRLATEDPPAPPPFDDAPIERAAHAAIVDTKAALRYIAANAAQYGIDPARIALFGESAGATAALGAGMSDPAAFRQDGDALPLPESNYPTTPAAAAAVIEFWGSADQILDQITPGDPPLLIAHGTADTNPGTGFEQAQAIAARCLEVNVPHELHPLPGTDHGAWTAQVDGKPLAQLVINFLTTHLP